jgi:hypothetical protein
MASQASAAQAANFLKFIVLPLKFGDRMPELPLSGVSAAVPHFLSEQYAGWSNGSTKPVFP